MKKIQKITFIGFAGIAGILLIFSAIGYFAAPVILKSSISKQFESIGFKGIQIGSIHIGLSSVRIYNVVIDPDNNSEIGYLAGTFTIPQVLNGKLNKLVIDKTVIHAKTAAALQDALLLNEKHDDKNATRELPFNEINIKKLTLKTSAPVIGDIDINVTGKAYTPDREKINVNGDYSIDHKLLLTEGRFSGKYEMPSQNYQLTVDVDKAKADHDDLILKRLIGWVSLEKKTDTKPSITAELNIGRMRYKDLPLKSITLTYNDDGISRQFLANGSAPNKAGSFAISAEADVRGNSNLTPTIKGNMDITADDLGRLNELSGEWALNKKLLGSGFIKTNFSAIKGDAADRHSVMGWNVNTASIFELNKVSYGDLIENLSTAGNISYNKETSNLKILIEEKTQFKVDGFSVTLPLMADHHPLVKINPFNQHVNLNIYSIILEKEGNYLKYNGNVEIKRDGFDAHEVLIRSNDGVLNTRSSDFELISQMRLDLSLSHLNLPSGNIQLKNIEAQKPQSILMPLSGDVVLTPQGEDKLTFKASLSDANGSFLVDFMGRHNMTTHVGSADVDIHELSFDGQVVTLSEIIPVSQEYISDVTGGVAANAHVNWNFSGSEDNFNAQATALLKSFSGSFSGFQVSNMNTVVQFDELFPLRFTDQEISIAAMNFGLPLTHGMVKASFDAGDENLLKLHRAEWDVAAGKVIVEPLSARLGRDEVKLKLSARELNLQTIFQSTNLEGIKASGRVSGDIPMTIYPNGQYSIKDGLLKTQEKGYFKYSPNKMPSFLRNPKNQNLLFLKQALNNFEYETLSLGIQSNPKDGQQIDLRAKGKNPDFYDGFPVDINLKLEGNVENVFKYSLKTYQIPDTIQEKIERYEQAREKDR